VVIVVEVDYEGGGVKHMNREKVIGILSVVDE
jgi:hypothetical protein